MVQRLTENGNVIGYRALPFTGAMPPLETMYIEGQEGIFLLRGRKDISALERIIIYAEKEYQKPDCKLFLLDEIGGIELVSQEFMKPLQQILLGGKPCIGVLKSWQNLSHAESVLKLGHNYTAKHIELVRLIQSKGKLITVTRENLRRARSIVSQFADRCVQNI